MSRKKLTNRSSSLDSSITFIAVSFRQVRPRVSMNVLWVEISSDIRGTGVWYLTFLIRVPESVIFIELKVNTYVAPSGSIILSSTFS